MKGYRTLLLNASAVLLPALQALDIAPSFGPQAAAIYAALLAMANIGLRLVTTTPVGGR